MELIVVGSQFVVCLAIIVIAGSRLAKYGDIIAVRTGLGHVWVGTVLLAAVTSLPELSTGISSVAIVKIPNLTIGDLFGSNMFNLMTIAIIDVLYRSGPVLRYVRTGIALTAAAGALLIATAAAFIFLSQNLYSSGIFGYIGFYSLLLFCLYLVMQYFVTRFAMRNQKEEDTSLLTHNGLSTHRVYLYFALAAVAVTGAGIWLGVIGEEIIGVTGLSASVVGTLFLALATSAPEIVVSISALRMGSPDLAVANLVGSNLFNMGVIIFVDDLFYIEGPIWSSINTGHIFSALVAVIMSLVIIITLVYRPTGPLRRIWVGIDAFVLVSLFVGAYLVLFLIGNPR